MTPTGDELAARGTDAAIAKAKALRVVEHPGTEFRAHEAGAPCEYCAVVAPELLEERNDVPEWLAADRGTLKLWPGHEHEWRAWPIVHLSMDVICIECGEAQTWPFQCLGLPTSKPSPAPFGPDDWSAARAYAIEGQWFSDALVCGFMSTARTSERTHRACLQHLASFHNG